MNFKRLIPFALLCASAYGQNAHPLVQPRWHFVDETGSPCVGCKLYSYLAGTTTQTPTYTDYLEVSQNTNPIILNAAGEANIWVGTPTIKLVLKHADGSLIWTVDHISTWGTGGGGGGGCTTVGASGAIQASDGAGGCAAAHVQVNGLNLLQDTTPNFVDTDGVQFHNPGTNQITATGTVIRVNDVATTPVSPVNLNDTLPAPDAGYVNAKVRQDGSANVSFEVPTTAALLQMNPPGPIDEHHFIIYPTGVTTSNASAATYANNTSSVSTVGPACAGSRITSATWTYTGALAAQVPTVTPANISAVSAFAYVGTSGTSVYVPFCGGPNGFFAPASTVSAGATSLLNTTSFFTTDIHTAVTGLTGATLEATTTFAQLAYSGGSTSSSIMTVPLVGLYVTDLVDSVPTPSPGIYVVPPLQIQTVNGVTSLALTKGFPQSIGTYGVASLPAAATVPNVVAWVTDSTDCVNHVGTFQYTECGTYQTGGNDFPWYWAPITTGGGGSGTYFTEIVSCTSTCTLTHTPATFDNLSINGLVMIDGTDFTRSGTTITLTTPAVGGDVYYAQYHY